MSDSSIVSLPGKNMNETSSNNFAKVFSYQYRGNISMISHIKNGICSRQDLNFAPVLRVSPLPASLACLHPPYSITPWRKFLHDHTLAEGVRAFVCGLLPLQAKRLRCSWSPKGSSSPWGTGTIRTSVTVTASAKPARFTTVRFVLMPQLLLKSPTNLGGKYLKIVM